MDEKARHAFGAHFTHEFDIHKVVGPTIVRPWRQRMDAAGKDPDKLRAVLDALRRFRVLDPACGCTRPSRPSAPKASAASAGRRN